MSEEVKIALPKLGESIVSAVVVEWFKKEGDYIQEDEPLLEVSTDKVNSEIPSPVAGTLKKILAKPDQELQVGETLALIESGAEQRKTTPEQEIEKTSAAPSEESEMKHFLSPAVLRIAREKGISYEELEKIPGSGGGGRLTKKDIDAYLQNKTSTCSEKFERVKMTGMRKAISENLVRSFYEAPHASLITEVDVTAIKELIQKQKEPFFKKWGVKLTITSFVARAIARAIKEFPFINSTLDGDTIVLKPHVNLGIAVSVEQGILVPVIQNCHTQTIPEIAKSVGELAVKARNNTLNPDDVQNGTITMTNFGMSGVLIGIPIIPYPQVAIIGIGAIQKRVVALEDDSMGVRSMMNLSLTFDHRVLDGMYGCSYLSAVKKHLEEDLSID